MLQLNVIILGVTAKIIYFLLMTFMNGELYRPQSLFWSYIYSDVLFNAQLNELQNNPVLKGYPH